MEVREQLAGAGSLFSSVMWVSRLKLGSSGLEASTLTCRASSFSPFSFLIANQRALAQALNLTSFLCIRYHLLSVRLPVPGEVAYSNETEVAFST